MDGKTNQFPCCIVSYTVPEGLWEGWRGPRKQQQYLEIVSPKATTLPEEEGKEVTRMREEANYLLIKLFN